MVAKQLTIIYIFRVLWIILAAALVLYVIKQNVFIERSLLYNLDFSRPLTRDINGWYPVSRTQFDTLNNSLSVKGEPIYLNAYLPVDFRTLTVKGNILLAGATARLGVKEGDQWFYKDLSSGDFTLSFALDAAEIKKRNIQLILSVPDYSGTSTVQLTNNWQLLFER